MRRFLPLLLLLACGTKRPPDDAHLIARPGEPCFRRLKPWEEEVGPPIRSTQNLPQCPPAEPIDRWRFFTDASPSLDFGFDRGDWNFVPDASRD